MIRTAIAALSISLLGACATVQAETPTAPVVEEANVSIGDLVGVWDISLFYSAEAPPSSTVMEIAAVEGSALTGTFYGSDFSTAQARAHEDKIVFSAVTTDGTGPYYHSGRLAADGSFEGQTLSTGRDFVMAWKAVKR